MDESSKMRVNRRGEFFSLDIITKDFSIDRAKMSATGVYAARQKDLNGDVLEIGGIDLSYHKMHPFALWMHGRAGLTFPIGKHVSEDGGYTASLDIDNGVARATTLFSQHLPEAEQIYWLIDEDIVRGQSIGARDIEVAPIRQNGQYVGDHIKRCLQLEISWTPCPTNPMATTDASRDAIRKVLSQNRIAGKSILPGIRKSLIPFAAKAKVWSPGASILKTEVPTVPNDDLSKVLAEHRAQMEGQHKSFLDELNAMKAKVAELEAKQAVVPATPVVPVVPIVPAAPAASVVPVVVPVVTVPTLVADSDILTPEEEAEFNKKIEENKLKLVHVERLARQAG